MPEATISRRQPIDPSILKLPPCPIPRPDDDVVWYQNGKQFEAKLIGHRFDAKPTVAYFDGGGTDLPSFEYIRVKNPFAKTGPNWLRLPSAAKVLNVQPTEKQYFESLLSNTMPPGVTYLEFIDEIWARGFEIYLVGGTVRDVIAGFKPNDIDLVTSMPLTLVIPLLHSMYRIPPALDKKALRNGHVRLGGRPGSRDPFADLSAFKFAHPGDENALFSSDISRDLGFRDFACNAVYYDPKNTVYVDPCGFGVPDAEQRRLTSVFNAQYRSRYNIATITVRFFKFTMRGFTPTDECGEEICANAARMLGSMTSMMRAQYIRTQILSKYPREQHPDLLAAYRNEYERFGLAALWDELIAPYETAILGR